MTVSELRKQLEKRHPDATVAIYFHESDVDMARHDYCIFDIAKVGDWGSPGSKDDLVTITGGALVGC